MSARKEKKKRQEISNQGLSRKDRDELKQRREMRRFKFTAVLIASLFVVATLAVIVIGDKIPFFNGIIHKNAVAMTVGDRDFSVAEYNFFYFSAYNSFVNTYGDQIELFGLDTDTDLRKQVYYNDTTWADYFGEEAVSSIEELAMFLDEAEKAGVSLTQEDLDSIDENVAQVSSYAEYYGIGADKYLQSIYGEGVTADVYRQIMQKIQTASVFRQQHISGLDYTEDEIKEYYNNNVNKVEKVDYRSFFVSGTASSDSGETDEEAMARAKETADEMAASVTDEQSFIDLAYENSTESSKSLYEDPETTLNKNKTSSVLPSEIVDWIYDGSRREGDVNVIETGSESSNKGYYVVYFLDRYLDEYSTVSVRHILITPEVDEGADAATDEQWADAKDRAEEIYQSWLDGEKTEETFGALAESSSEDTSSNVNGGLYETLYKDTFAGEAEEWCFSSSRAAGDCEVVKSDDGYHILYFVDKGDTAWKCEVRETLLSEEYNAWYNERISNYIALGKSFGMRYTKTKMYLY